MSERYKGKVILAPMVRVCTLPMRLLAQDFGADLLYCEEIIDHKILSSKRVVNDVLGTVDYVMNDETVIFRTCQREKSQLIFQLGTSNAKRALEVAKKVEADVSGLDINMGCPKEFSIKGGMGSALLTQPEKIKEILTTLVNGLTIPVTCKIRIRHEWEDSLELVKLIESTGVAAIAVHGRTRWERSQHPNRIHIIKKIAETLSIPVIANGGSRDIKTFDQIKEFWEEAGTSSVMIARAAEWNCSVFRREGPLPLYDVIRKYLRYAAEYDNNPINTKYCVLQMLKESMKEPEGEAMLSVLTHQEIFKVWGMSEFYEDVLRRQREKEESLRTRLGDRADEEVSIKRRKTEDGTVLYELPVRFLKKDYPPCVTPKQRLHDWAKRFRMRLPQYDTVDRKEDRYFNSVITFDGCKYTTPFWEKSKPIAEQGAAIACMIILGEDDGRLDEAKSEREALRRKWIEMKETSSSSKELNHKKRNTVSESSNIYVNSNSGKNSTSKTEKEQTVDINSSENG